MKRNLALFALGWVILLVGLGIAGHYDRERLETQQKINDCRAHFGEFVKGECANQGQIEWKP